METHTIMLTYVQWWCTPNPFVADLQWVCFIILTRMLPPPCCCCLYWTMEYLGCGVKTILEWVFFQFCEDLHILYPFNMFVSFYYVCILLNMFCIVVLCYGPMASLLFLLLLLLHSCWIDVRRCFCFCFCFFVF